MYVSLLCLLQPHHRETVSSPRRSGRWYRLRVLGLHLPPSPCHPPSCALLLAQSRLVGARRHASSPSGLWLCFDQWGTLGGETESKRTWDVKAPSPLREVTTSWLLIYTGGLQLGLTLPPPPQETFGKVRRVLLAS